MTVKKTEKYNRETSVENNDKKERFSHRETGTKS